MSTLVMCCCLVFASAPLQGPSPDTLNALPQQVPTSSATSDTLVFHDPMGIVVTALRTAIPLRVNPAATSVLDRQALDVMPRAIAVDEAVRMVPGVKVDNQADGERVHMSIRGQGILSERGLRGIKVLQDGLPLNDPTGFAPDLYDVDWSNVQRMEILRGPGASLYGGGATAGVLNITTTPAGSEAGGLTGSLRSGSNGFWKAAAWAGGGSANLGYHISLSRTEGDGYRVHTAFDATNLYAKGEWRVTERLHLTPILALTQFFNQNAEGLNLTWMAEDRKQANPDATVFNEYQRTHRVTAGIVGSLETSPATWMDFNAYVRRTEYKEPVPSSVQHRSFVGPGATLQISHQTETGFVGHTLGVGTDLQWQTIDESRHPNLGAAREGPELLSDETIDQSGTGLFLFDRMEFNEKWGGMVNLRYDRITNRLEDHLQAGGMSLSGKADFDQLTLRLGLSYSPSESMGFFANWGQGFLPPATEELANNPAAQGGFNQGLEAATSWGEEVGVRGLLGQVFLYDLTAFHLETEGDFDRYRIPSRPLETFYRNGGNSRRFGVEVHENWHLLDALWLEAAYTWSHFVYQESTSFYGDIKGNRLPNSPDHQLMTDLSWDVSPHLRLGVGTDSYAKWFVDASNTVPVDGYTLLNARMAWTFPAGGREWEFSVQGRNLTGTRYVAFTEPDPDGNSYQPGPEQEIFAGLRVVTP
jgi:iron complex outermembrane receptor protein